MSQDKEQRRKNVLEVLNKARSMELQAIHQYMNQHYGLDDMDFGEMAANMKLVAIDEMRHAEQFAERIKELGGEPTTEKEGPVERNQEVGAIFAFDVGLEDDTVDAYNQFAIVARENGDSITVKLFETIIEEEQEHLNYFDNVKKHIEALGDAYLSKVAGTPSSTGLAPQGFTIRNQGA
ncbi:ferritin-like domain-containing protein [Desulfovibrio inopinatus]|uniref:ferritin-like domain-containing protein n=1 Tax=Desulfovibrio inopinatus TaxID=102109 RepID=UPI0003F4BF6B|nr:ferritin-like domain-containing protein [Desulfovibrio inopinatus]